MVRTAKSSYDATETRIQNYAAELILLDETLRDYGDSALPPRRLLRSYTELFMQILWPKTGAAGELGESGSASALMERPLCSCVIRQMPCRNVDDACRTEQLPP